MRAFPKNRRYCGACQALRDLNFRPGMKCDCDTCGTTFWPYRTSHTRCYKCAIFNYDSSENPECARCKQHYRTAPGLSDTCCACVTSSKDTQEGYRRALALRIRKIKDKEAA